MNEIRIIPIEGIPEIKVNDNLAEITFDVLNKSEGAIEKNDIFIVTQKIVSKSEGMERNLSNYEFFLSVLFRMKKVFHLHKYFLILKHIFGPLKYLLLLFFS